MHRTYERKRRKTKKMIKRKRLVKMSFFFIIVLVVLCFVCYLNSYHTLVKKGYDAIENGEYKNAEEYFNKAIKKHRKRPDAYTGFASLCMKQNRTEDAEKQFLDAIEEFPSVPELYEALFEFYFSVENPQRISDILETCEDEKTFQILDEYYSPKPKFSLKETRYDDVQQLSLESEGDIYYTTDGSDVSVKSNRYKEPIHLSEGETVIRAISVNEKGVPSLTEEHTYTIELPGEDAPRISPSTGEYHTGKKIEIQVPEGCTAYYTLDGSVPTEKSQKYTQAIDMPEGDTLFTAILIDSRGRKSEVSKRHYHLILK